MKQFLFGVLFFLPLIFGERVSFTNVKSIGRTVRTEEGSIQSDWTNSGITFQFQASESETNLGISFANCQSGCHSFVSVEVNCQRLGKYEISASSVVNVTIPTPANAVYEVSVRKITETLCGDAYGVFEITDLSLSNAAVLPQREYQDICGSATQKKIVIFGDSYTAAYGVDQPDPCVYSAATQDVTHGYAYLAAQDAKADIHIIAWSGKGAVRNYGDKNQMSVDPLPSYYNRTLGAFATPDRNTNFWNPRRFPADLIVVMLGTNDYSTEPHPSDDQFVGGLSSFINTVKKEYQPDNILVLCAPASPAVQCQNIQAAAVATASTYLHIADDVFNGGKGCSGHPSVQTQRNMANFILPTVQKMLA